MKNPFLKIRWSENSRQLKFGNGMWEFGPLSFILPKKVTKTLRFCLPKFPSTLHFFKEFAVSEKRADFSKLPTCQDHLFIHGESIDLSSVKTDMNCDFSYQSVDCLFTILKYYFSCITQNNGFVFRRLSSTIEFLRSFQFPVQIWVSPKNDS